MGMFGHLTRPLDPRVQALVSGNPLPAAPLSPSAKRRINATPTEKQVYKMFGMEPGIKRPALLPMPSNMARTSEPINWKDWTAPSALYDLARAVVSPSVADQMTPEQMQEEARNTAWSIPAASVAAAAPAGMFGRGMAHDPNTMRMGIGHVATHTEQAGIDSVEKSLSDDVARLARGKAQGFNVDRPYWHGGPEKIDRIDTALGGGNYGQGFYITRRKDAASEYAGANGVTHEVYIKPDRVLDLTTPEGRAIYQSTPHAELRGNFDIIRAPGESIVLNEHAVRLASDPFLD